ncbi:guanine nucleotide-binding protein subunit alpha [Kappamyces sp. JEL0829]|nr:guanine nucleotide-binding protein subunit alpha [Kappamyces sp. JEL0829]
MDILKVRIVTQAISETIFTIEDTRFHFFDVSGLKHHRSYWIPYFQNVTSILFVVSLDSYNQTMVEDSTMNRMADSIFLFDQISNNELLSGANLIIFFNKKDLYSRKVKTIPIEETFPDYQGKPNSVSQGIKFFDKKFRQQVKSKTTALISHYTCCTDTDAMKIIILSVM